MVQERSASLISSSAEIEDWLAMELEEEKGCRTAAVEWCIAHARPILSLASLTVIGLVLAAMVFG